MSIAIDSLTSQAFGTAGTTKTVSSFTVGSGANRLLLVCIAMNNRASNGPSAVTSVTFDGVALTSVGSATNSDDGYVEIWSLTNPAATTGDVVVTLDVNGTGTALIVGVISLTGVDQTTPLGTFASATGNTGTLTVDISSAAAELVVDTAWIEGNRTLTVGADQTQRWNIYEAASDTALDGVGAGSTEAGASTVTMSWSASASSHWVTCGISVKPAAAAAEERLSPIRLVDRPLPVHQLRI